MHVHVHVFGTVACYPKQLPVGKIQTHLDPSEGSRCMHLTYIHDCFMCTRSRSGSQGVLSRNAIKTRKQYKTRVQDKNIR